MKYAGKYYASLKTFNRSYSNMNKLCWDIEKWSKKIRFKNKYKDFDYSIMMNPDVVIDEGKYNQLCDLYLEFEKEMRELQKQNNMQANSENYENYFGDLSKAEILHTQVNWKFYYDQYKMRARQIVKNMGELATYVVKICYYTYPTKNKKFIWAIASEGILENLKQQMIQLPIQDDNGEYLYLGRKYTLQEVIPSVE